MWMESYGTRTFYAAYILFLESSRATAKKCGLRVLDKYFQHGMKDIFQARSNAKLTSFKLILICFLHMSTLEQQKTWTEPQVELNLQYCAAFLRNSTTEQRNELR
jgi:hypothetical protein